MKTYRDFQPLADELYLKLYGKPKSHQEWCEGFNKRGEMIRILMKHNNEK